MYHMSDMARMRQQDLRHEAEAHRLAQIAKGDQEPRRSLSLSIGRIIQMVLVMLK
jgi:hypothetical protein